mmetsp:Transcript_39632/g.112375  ORF Transcript_39632/g.112375 Transcript_39632/m.112375 type:complete len:514 (-) Transcript_39632:108-1649(-)
MALRSLALASLAAAATAAPDPHAIPERYRSMDSQVRPARGARAGEYPAPRFVTQRLDHFDGSNLKRWQQAYYVNDKAWKRGSSAPVFLCVGGEGPPLDGSAVVDSVHCNVAVEWLEETGALMFALEHRYYGCHNRSACPVPDLGVKGAMRYLSSRQALGDIAAFVRFARHEYGLTEQNKWVTWGGSYPGMLAGWARLKFPHLIHAAVASSAPVRAELEMQGYFDVVGDAYAVVHEDVGGSPACREAIAEGHRRIGKMFGSVAGLEQLAALFGGNAANYADEEQQRSFAGYGVASFPAQSNDPACDTPMCDIGRICKAMTDRSLGDEVDRLAHVRRSQRGGSGARSAADVAPHAGDEEAVPGYGHGWQLWAWQTCTEFGFYQTCATGSRCIFTQGLATLSSEMDFCTRDFGIPAEVVADNIVATSDHYGSDRPSGSRVMWASGEVDPWRANSINEPFGGFPVLDVDGASHHFWTHASLPTDQDSVVAARHIIREQVRAFLAEEGAPDKAAAPMI